MGAEIIILIIILMFSVILHEVAHGAAANMLGDPTAKHEGRLTLNPVPHIDMLGTIIVPGTLALMGTGFLFGWAKPVPYNPYNLKGRYGELFVAAAGPLTNIALALAAGFIYRVGIGILPEPLAGALILTVLVNLFLAILNLLPIPPLDGAKIISSALPVTTRLSLEEKIARVVNVNSIVFMIAALLFIVFFLVDYIGAAVQFLTAIIIGK